jgi:hypothetical protein
MMKRVVSSTTSAILVWLLIACTTKSCNAQWASHSYTGGAVALGMSFDAATNIGMVVGGAYQETFGLFTPGQGPRCLVGVFDNTIGKVVQRLAFTDLEVCTHVVTVGNRTGIILGYQPEQEQTGDIGVTKVDEIIGTLDLTTTPPTTSFQTIASDYRITYPVQGALNQDGSAMYVAFHETDTVPSSLKDQTLDPLSQIIHFEDEMQSGNEESTNAIWSPGVQKFNVVTNEVEWDVSSVTTSTDDRVTVLSSVAYVAQGDFLLVGGYTKGSTSDTWNGFLTKMDPSTGALIGVTKYIITQDGKNDIVRDICVSGKYAFVVGSTEGILDGIHAGGAFLLKVDVDTLDISWPRQIPGEAVEGMYCAIHEETDIVYIGGNVPENIQFEIGEALGTGGDVFVAQVDTGNATIFWTRQFGSDSTHVTIHGLATDQDGDAVLCGNSFNETAWKNDAFILNMKRKDGAHTPNFIQLVPAEDENDTKNDRKGLIIAGSIILPILLAVMVLLFEYNRRGSREEIPQDHQEAAVSTAADVLKGESSIPVLKDAQIL